MSSYVSEFLMTAEPSNGICSTKKTAEKIERIMENKRTIASSRSLCGDNVKASGQTVDCLPRGFAAL